MSLRKLASSLAFCCARAPTNVSIAPAKATATYSSHRQCWLRLRIALPGVVIRELLATQGQEFAGGCPNAWRLRYSFRHHIASVSTRQPIERRAREGHSPLAGRRSPVNPLLWPNPCCVPPGVPLFSLD